MESFAISRVLHLHTEKSGMFWSAAGLLPRSTPPEGLHSTYGPPSQSGTYFLWTVLNDNRGGVDFAETPMVVN